MSAASHGCSLCTPAHTIGCACTAPGLRVVNVTELSELLNRAKGDRVVDRLIADAEKQGHKIHRGTIYRALDGDHAKHPRDETLRAFAAVFGVDVGKLRQAVKRPAGELGPWVPVSDSAQLDRDQRKALDQLIKAIVRAGGQSNVAESRQPAPATRETKEEAAQRVLREAKQEQKGRRARAAAKKQLKDQQGETA